MAATKPVFAVFPGSFHPHECLQPLLTALKAEGYETRSATLRSTGNDTGDIQGDVDLMRGVVLPVLEQGKDVVLVLHSYAGFPGSMAIEGLRTPKQPGHGRLLGVVYMTAFIPREGVSVIDMLGGKWLDWLVPDAENKQLYAVGPMDIFFQDCPQEEAKQVAATLVGHSLVCLTEKIPAVYYNKPEFDGHRAYVRCGVDAALLPPVQDMLMDGSGVQWIVKDIEAGHSPFMAKPKELATILGELAVEFAKEK